MAVSNRMASFLATMRWEGGDKLSRDPRDPGNWTGGRVGVGVLKGTKWGVAACAHPTLDIGKLTADEALSIFLESYWRPVGGDDLPPGMDHVVSDDAYNSGIAAALRRLRRVESRIGAQSVAARIQTYSQLRLSFLESLKSWRIFKLGWTRRVAGVEAESLKMALGAPAATPLHESTRDRHGLLTPADVMLFGPAPISGSAIAQMRSEAEEACAAAGWRVAFIFVALIAGALWGRSPVRLLGLPMLAVALLASLRAWRIHGVRRDALTSLVVELGIHAD
jgi:lysozyme family protein